MKSRKSQFVLIAMLAFGICLWTPGAVAANLKKDISACGTINQSGQYALVQNVTGAGDCLVVQADFVTIDFAGYTLTGNQTGSGITDGNSARKGTAIRGGTITNFEFGISLGTSQNTSVERMRVIDNFHTGAYTGPKAVVKDSLFSGNGHGSGGGYPGLVVGDGSVVTGNVSNNNSEIGIALGGGRSTAISNVAMDNSVGIQVFTGGGTIVNNTVSGNQFGFIIQCASNVIGNTAVANGLDLELLGTSACNNNNNVAITVGGTP